MALRIEWSNRAVDQLDEILDYLTDEFGQSAASKFAKRIYKFTDALVVFPEIGKLQNHQKQIRGFVVEKQNTIFYKVFPDHVRILTLYDNRQNPRKKNKNLIIKK